MEQTVTFDTALSLFQEGDYAKALEQLEALPESPRREVYRLAAAGLSSHPVKGEALVKFWDALYPLLNENRDHALVEEGRGVLSVFANTVFRNCNQWQMLEYAKIQKDVKLENKEFMFDEFRRLLLIADDEYRTVLRAMYGYAALADEMCKEGADEAFILGALKNMQQIAELQFQIDLREEYDPLVLAEYACRLDLSSIPEGDEKRRELLNYALQGEQALQRWGEFAPYADPAKKKELEKEVRKAHFAEKLKFWKRIKKAVRV